MTPTFSRPNAAMFAYEMSLLKPRRWPPTQLDVAGLWQRAKPLFAVVTDTIASAASLFQRLRFTYAERRKLVARLVPVEKLVRMLMMIEAATFLLMTPEGRKLREETPKIDPPAPPKPTALPVGVAKPPHSTRIEMPGWHTLAALHPRIDPRVVEREQREQREALERRIAGLETLTQDAPADAAPDSHDPQTWHCGFRVLHWVHTRDDEDMRPPMPMPPPLPPHRPRLMTFSDTNFPLAPGMKLVHAPQRDSQTDDAPFNTGRDLARRIAALARILANPAAAIRRLARRLAALPADTLPEPWITHYETRDWHHGVPENWNACALAQPAFRALAWSERMSEARKHDPG